MPLTQVNNGDSGSSARTKINASFTQVDTNTTAIAALPTTYQPLDADLTAIAALTPSNDDSIFRVAGAWVNRTVAQAKAILGLNNVDNTSDANKPVSTATQTALNLKQDAESTNTTYFKLSLGETVSRNLLAADYNSLIQFQLAAPATLTFPNSILTFYDGGIVYIQNSDTSLASVTIAAGGGAVLYVGAKGTTLAAGETAGIIRLAPTEWLRLF